MRIWFLTLLVAAPALAQSTAEPEVLSESTRSFLKSKLKGHNKDMRDLTIAVAIQKMSEVQRLAQAMASVPKVERSAPADVKVPARFYELQDQFKKTSQELADAGKAEDSKATVEKFQLLITQCVGCHGSFKQPAK